MKNGDVVFFKRAKKSSARKAPEVEFKGHGFGIMLGHVPPFQKDPPRDHLLRLMGTVGFLTFDDVAEFLGDESGAACVKKFEDKYYGKVLDPAQAELPLEEMNSDDAPEALGEETPDTVSSLVDVMGEPIPRKMNPPEDSL